jgi:hypothetical protein
VLFAKLGYTGISLVVVLIIIALIVDTSIVSIATSTGGLRSSSNDTALFVIMSVIFAGGQYIILGFVKHQFKDKDKIGGLRTNLMLIENIVVIVQYVLVAILVFTISQMVLTMSYNIVFLRAAVLVTYGLSLILLGILARRFFSWFRSNRNLVVLVYALATTMISINALITIIYINNQFNFHQSDSIRPVRSVTGTFTAPDVIFSSAYIVTSVSSFILMWIATVLLLRHYSKKLGRAKYWIIVSIPLGYFLSEFQPLFLYSFSDFRMSDPVLFGIIYNLIFAISKPLCGLLFGIAFWSVARSLTNETVKGYMMISAFGMMLLFTSNQPVGLTLLPFPPFGLATICFMGLASYLVFVGIYSSAISVSQDSSLRRSIRKYAFTESKLLDSIGSAEMEQQIQRRVIDMTKQNQYLLENETGIEPSLNEDEVKEYLHEVLKEAKKGNEQKGAK